jgi:hypothetical protein
LLQPVAGQELEPRSYSPAPVGTQFLVVGYGSQSGEVIADPSFGITDITAHIQSVSLGYGSTFGLAGRQANLSVALPYVFGDVSGNVRGEFRQADRSALADIRLRFWVGLAGLPALSPRQFASYKRGTAIGASLLLVAPTGQYDPAKLINVGSNRWSIKPEIGLAYPTGRWTLEGTAGVWFFTANHHYFGGARFEQAPRAAFQAYVTYTFRPGLWLAAGGTYVVGGRTSVNGVEQDTAEKNSRLGLTLTVPVAKQESVKLGWARGLTTRRGRDFTTLAIAWQRAWF